jgi:glyoxylase-like metal-dependent hydrolase (beta-lactamase superfamily II)
MNENASAVVPALIEPWQGIHTIDTAQVRPKFAAAYLIEGEGRGALVDCGTNHSVPHILAALDRAGMNADQIDWLILTHVHLDHGGGAGALLPHLPNARVVVHPRGARHMIDPSKLIAGATAVYGDDAMQAMYGTLQPIPAERVVEAGDGFEVELAGRPLVCLDAPGHARHHIVIHDAQSDVFFTGDTFGISYREFDTDQGAFVFPTTTPVQFEPEALHASIERMLSFHPKAMFPTHFGRVDEVERLAADMHAHIDAMVALARACDGRQDRHQCLVDGLRAQLLSRARDHGVTLDEATIDVLLDGDVELNAQGLEVWLDTTRKRSG